MRTRGRARRAGIPFTLSPGFVAALFDEQTGRCAVSRFAFDLQCFPDALVKHPFAPSLDQKLRGRGYTADNVRLVCVAVNFGMNEWGAEVFKRIARATVGRGA
jgi:hypothetical protein